jgi:uncharacterized membrane protein YphA (DoxX/SURF4 family)
MNRPVVQFLIEKQFIQRALTYFLSLILVFAGMAKVFHFSEFHRSLLNYTVIPREIVNFIDGPVVLAEMWIGIGLIIPTVRRMSAFFALCLLILFAVVVTLEYTQGSTVSCGCGVPLLSEEIDLTRVVVNWIFVFIGLVVFLGTNFSERR